MVFKPHPREHILSLSLSFVIHIHERTLLFSFPLSSRMSVYVVIFVITHEASVLGSIGPLRHDGWAAGSCAMVGTAREPLEKSAKTCKQHDVLTYLRSLQYRRREHEHQMSTVSCRTAVLPGGIKAPL